MRPTIEAKRKTLEASLDKRLGAPTPAAAGSAPGPKK
jgi:hypothetical protein